jgi:glycine/D-amino acid oxidase-like deaminating enzyme
MKKINTDIIIIGAGIAGLWLHHRLNDMGYHAVLIEKNALGVGQTLSSQGIIHGGAKYTLHGILSNAASAIAEMPSRWISCLEGRGDINLSNTQILSHHQCMWSTQDLSSKITSFFSINTA